MPGCSSCPVMRDRKSTRLNSSHLGISYAVFCLKKKTKLEERRRKRASHSRTRAWRKHAFAHLRIPSTHHDDLGTDLHAAVEFYVFFFKDPKTAEINTLSLHDALPI